MATLRSRVQQRLVAACLRQRAPLALLQDAFVAEALALLRPQFPRLDAARAALADTRTAVRRDVAHWLRTSALVLSLADRGDAFVATDQWRRRVLLPLPPSPSSSAAGEDRQRRLPLLPVRLPTHCVIAVCSDAPTAFGAREDRDEATEEADAEEADAKEEEEENRRRVALTSRCLVRASLGLWSLVLPLVSDAGAATVAAGTAREEDVGSRPQWALLLQTLQRASDANAELLAPFAWLFALSESRTLSASEVLLCWLWLLATVASTSTTAPTTSDGSTDREPQQQPQQQEQRQPQPPVLTSLVSAMRSVVRDHHVVAWLLDPRVRGAGLSTVGRRRAQSLVAQVAERLWARGRRSDLSRARLLAQLGQFLDVAGPFGDSVVWEMARGRAPELFWADYAADAAELAHVATAVLSFPPLTRSVDAYVSSVAGAPASSSASSASPTMSTTAPDKAGDGSAWDVEQIRFHFEQNHQLADDATDRIRRFRDLLLASDAATSATPTAPLDARATANAMRGELLQNYVERLTAAAADARESMERYSIEVDDAFLDDSWLAFQTNEDMVAIKAAALQLVPAQLVPQPSSGTSSASPIINV
ncbi:hypothetical protein PINS_up003469 [Pythium insidiosum]|nr:hypothetical protein PINS_up003469 [Pythium insidiosum]